MRILNRQLFYDNQSYRNYCNIKKLWYNIVHDCSIEWNILFSTDHILFTLNIKYNYFIGSDYFCFTEIAFIVSIIIRYILMYIAKYKNILYELWMYYNFIKTFWV